MNRAVVIRLPLDEPHRNKLSTSALVEIENKTKCDTPDCDRQPAYFVWIAEKQACGVKCEQCHRAGMRQSRARVMR